MQFVLDIEKENSELSEALYLLASAVKMVKCQKGFTTTEFHLNRVQVLGKGNAELELHLRILTECVHILRMYV